MYPCSSSVSPLFFFSPAPTISMHLPFALLPPVCPSLSSSPILISSHLSPSPARMVTAISQSITLNPFFFLTRLLIHLPSLSALLPQKIKGLRIFSCETREACEQYRSGEARNEQKDSLPTRANKVRARSTCVHRQRQTLYEYGKCEICNLIVFYQALARPEEKHRQDQEEHGSCSHSMHRVDGSTRTCFHQCCKVT